MLEVIVAGVSGSHSLISRLNTAHAIALISTEIIPITDPPPTAWPESSGRDVRIIPITDITIPAINIGCFIRLLSPGIKINASITAKNKVDSSTIVTSPGRIRYTPFTIKNW
jgi:hypothetical protein